MGTEDDKLAVSHKNLGRLVGTDGAVKGINGVGKGGDIGLALLLVKEKKLPVRVAEGAADLAVVLRGCPV